MHCTCFKTIPFSGFHKADGTPEKLLFGRLLKDGVLCTSEMVQKGHSPVVLPITGLGKNGYRASGNRLLYHFNCHIETGVLIMS